MLLHIGKSLSVYVLLSAILLTGCHSGKKLSEADNHKVLLGEYSKGWLKYKVYLLPHDNIPEVRKKHQPDNMMLSIMIINMQDNTSPLRKLCTNLDDYNTYYEYLLNRCKEDITVRSGEKLMYPISYSFENNYNSFPFETINVGYRYDLHKEGARAFKELYLTYNDKVFLHDTINLQLNYIKK